MSDIRAERRLRIGELAAELGITPTAIRDYETTGRLPEPKRTPAGYRVYDEDDRAHLLFVLKAKAIDLTLEEIGGILAARRNGEPPFGHVLALLDRKRASVDERLRAPEV